MLTIKTGYAIAKGLCYDSDGFANLMEDCSKGKASNYLREITNNCSDSLVKKFVEETGIQERVSRVYQVSIDIEMPCIVDSDINGELITPYECIEELVEELSEELSATKKDCYVRGWSQEYSWSIENYSNGLK